MNLEDIIKSGKFPECTIGTSHSLDFMDYYFVELNNSTVYIVIYTIGRLTEYGYLCDGLYINRRSRIVTSYDDYFERLQGNSDRGTLRIKLADISHEEFLEIYKQIID